MNRQEKIQSAILACGATAIAVVLLLLLVLFKPQHLYHTYALSGQKTVQCENRELEHCGMYLSHCKDGNEYLCQTNVREEFPKD